MHASTRSRWCCLKSKKKKKQKGSCWFFPFIDAQLFFNSKSKINSSKVQRWGHRLKKVKLITFIGNFNGKKKFYFFGGIAWFHFLCEPWIDHKRYSIVKRLKCSAYFVWRRKLNFMNGTLTRETFFCHR